MSSLSTNAGKSRSRTWGPGSKLSDQWRVWEHYDPPSDDTITYFNPVLVSLDWHQYTGRDIPNFHKRKNRGELLPYTSYSRMDETYTCSGTNDRAATDGSWAQTFKPDDQAIIWDSFTHGTYTIMDNFISGLNIDPSYYVQSAASSLYGRGWDALTFAAEFHHVVRMFRNLYPKIRKLTEDIKYKDLKRFWNVPFNEWLEFRYGWRILVYDIQDINRLIKSLDEKQLARSKERVGEQFVDEKTNLIIKSGVSGTCTWSKDESWDLSVRGSIIADFTPPRVRTNLIASAWELMTLSFVVDWFLTVGKSIDAISFLMSSGNYTAAYGYSFKYRSTQHGGSFTPNPGFSGNMTRDAEHSLDIFVRVPTTIPFTPLPHVNLNAFKVGDLTALLFQFVQKLFR